VGYRHGVSVSIAILIAAVLGLVVGPLLMHTWLGSKRWQAGLDGFILVAVVGMALIHLLPEALAHGGIIAAALAVVGLVLPWLIHHVIGAHRSETTILVAGLAVHAAVETAVLGASPDDHALALGAAIVFHRLPVGMVVFAAAEARHSARRAWLSIAVLAGATVLGYVGGDGLAGSFSAEHYAWLQALVAGSLLHVAFGHEDHHEHHDHAHEHCDHDHGHGHHDDHELGHHHDHGHGRHHDHGHGHHHDHHHDHGHGHHGHNHDHGHSHDEYGHHHSHSATMETITGSIGGLLGLGTVAFALSHGHDHSSGGGTVFLETALALALESAPALLLAYLLAGVIGVAITPARARWLDGGSSASQSLRGVVFGLPLPICSCGVLPLYETLVKRGVPATAAMGFLIATPELGIDAIILSFPLLGVDLTVARLAAAFAIAMLVALFVGRMVKRPEVVPADDTPRGERPPLKERLVEGLRFGLVELFDHTMPWIVVGLLIAALAQPILAQPWLQALPASVQVPLFALIGIPLYVCASGATPIAAILVYNGVSPGAALAFLLAGPATNVTTFGILAQLHGKRVAVLFGAAVTAAAVAAGWMIDGFGVAAATGVDIHAHEVGTVLEWLCLSALGLLFAASVLRQGPRGVVQQVTDPMGH